MEFLKFAFDTLIVGVLALPWLAIFIRMFAPGIFLDEPGKTFPLLTALPEHTREAIASAMIVALGYLLGSAISRTSGDFFDDEFWGGLPTESAIRKSVYADEYCGKENVFLAQKLPGELIHPHPPALCAAKPGLIGDPGIILEYFRRQEATLLLAGGEKNARLKEFHDQIVVLRGATMNGLILFVSSIFGYCAEIRRGLTWRNIRKPLSFMPAWGLVLYGCWSIRHHFHELGDSHPMPYSDPPLAELVLVVLGTLGLLAASHDEHPRFYRNACLLALVVTMIAYGGWWWTEVIYDQQVIHSFHTLPLAASGP
jgi:hypothetical protein